MEINIRDVKTPPGFQNSALQIDILVTEITLAMNSLDYEIPQGAFTIDIHVNDYDDSVPEQR